MKTMKTLLLAVLLATLRAESSLERLTEEEMDRIVEEDHRRLQLADGLSWGGSPETTQMYRDWCKKHWRPRAHAQTHCGVYDNSFWCDLDPCRTMHPVKQVRTKCAWSNTRVLKKENDRVGWAGCTNAKTGGVRGKPNFPKIQDRQTCEDMGRYWKGCHQVELYPGTDHGRRLEGIEAELEN